MVQETKESLPLVSAASSKCPADTWTLTLNEQALSLPFSYLNLLQELHDILERALVDSDSETIKLSIRALANAAHPSSLKKIVMLLPGFGNVCGILEPQVIVDAVLSLRRFAKIVPRQVRGLRVSFSCVKKICTAILFTNVHFTLINVTFCNTGWADCYKTGAQHALKPRTPYGCYDCFLWLHSKFGSSGYCGYPSEDWQ